MGDIIVCLAGRAAELKEFGAAGVSTGAEDDLKQVTSLTSRMASLWSMAAPGPVLSISDDSSPAARQRAEERAQAILDDAWTQALECLDRHKRAHAALVAALLERETVEGAEIEAIVATYQNALSTFAAE
jgi:cell division protease FtsH